MLADTSLPCGSDANLSAVGSLSQKLSHHQIASVACSGRIPLVEQRVLLQFTLLRQPVKRLSRRTHLACLKTVVFLLPLAMTNREAFLHTSHLTVAMAVCSDEQWHDSLHMKPLRCALANIRGITPMRLRQSSYRAVIFGEAT